MNRLTLRPGLPALLLLFTLLLPALTGCAPAAPEIAAPEIRLDALHRHWVHAFEEEQDAPDTLIYRPDDFREFPPARFRMQYTFESDGTCSAFYLAPNDAHHFRPCTWRYDTEEAVLHIQEEDQQKSYHILKLGDDLLRMIPATGDV